MSNLQDYKKKENTRKKIAYLSQDEWMGKRIYPFECSVEHTHIILCMLTF